MQLGSAALESQRQRFAAERRKDAGVLPPAARSAWTPAVGNDFDARINTMQVLCQRGSGSRAVQMR